MEIKRRKLNSFEIIAKKKYFSSFFFDLFCFFFLMKIKAICKRTGGLQAPEIGKYKVSVADGEIY